MPFKKLDMQDHNNSYKQTFNEASTVTIVMKHKLEDDQKRLELTLRWGLCNNNDGDDDDDDAADTVHSTWISATEIMLVT